MVAVERVRDRLIRAAGALEAAVRKTLQDRIEDCVGLLVTAQLPQRLDGEVRVGCLLGLGDEVRVQVAQ